MVTASSTLLTTSLETYLSWSLGEETPYQAGTELRATVSFALPEEGNYYLLGALYTPDTLQYIRDTLFGVLVPEGADYAANDPNLVSVFRGKQGESLDLPVRFTLGRTGVVLALFLLRMTGEGVDLSVDEQVGVVTTGLVKLAGMDLSGLLAPLLVVGMMASVIGLVTRDSKESKK